MPPLRHKYGNIIGSFQTKITRTNTFNACEKWIRTHADEVDKKKYDFDYVSNRIKQEVGPKGDKRQLRRWWNCFGKPYAVQKTTSSKKQLLYELFVQDFFEVRDLDLTKPATFLPFIQEKKYAKRTRLTERIVCNELQDVGISTLRIGQASDNYCITDGYDFDPNDNKCPHCKNGPFPGYREYSRHVSKDHPHCCTHCPDRFVTPGNLKEHFHDTHKKIEICPTCHRRRKHNTIRWTQHLRAKHRHKCGFPKCRLWFRRTKHLNEHSVTHCWKNILPDYDMEELCRPVPSEENVHTATNTDELYDWNEYSAFLTKQIEERQAQDDKTTPAPTLESDNDSSQNDNEDTDSVISENANWLEQGSDDEFPDEAFILELSTATKEQLAQLPCCEVKRKVDNDDSATKTKRKFGDAAADRMYKILREETKVNCKMLRISKNMVMFWRKEGIIVTLYGRNVLFDNEDFWLDDDLIPDFGKFIKEKGWNQKISTCGCGKPDCNMCSKTIKENTSYTAPNFFKRLKATNAFTYAQKLRRLEKHPRRSHRCWLGSDALNGFIPELETKRVDTFLTNENMTIDMKRESPETVLENNETPNVSGPPDLDMKSTSKRIQTRMYISNLVQVSDGHGVATILFSSTDRDGTICIEYSAGGRLFRNVFKSYHIRDLRIIKTHNRQYVSIHTSDMLPSVENVPDPTRPLDSNYLDRPHFRNRTVNKHFNCFFDLKTRKQVESVMHFCKKQRVHYTLTTLKDIADESELWQTIFKTACIPSVESCAAEFFDPETQTLESAEFFDPDKMGIKRDKNDERWNQYVPFFLARNRHLVELVLKLREENAQKLQSTLIFLKAKPKNLTAEQQDIHRLFKKIRPVKDSFLQSVRYRQVATRYPTYLPLPLHFKFRLFYEQLTLTKDLDKVMDVPFHRPGFRSVLDNYNTRVPEDEWICCICGERNEIRFVTHRSHLQKMSKYEDDDAVAHRNVFATEPGMRLLSTVKYLALKNGRASQATAGHICTSCYRQKPHLLDKPLPCIAVPRGEVLPEVKALPQSARSALSRLSVCHHLKTIKDGYKKIYPMLETSKIHYFLKPGKSIFEQGHGHWAITLHKSQAPEEKRNHFRKQMQESIEAALEENPDTTKFQCSQYKCKYTADQEDIMNHTNNCSVFESRFYSEAFQKAQVALKAYGADINVLPADAFITYYNDNKGKKEEDPKQIEDFYTFINDLDTVISSKMPDDATAATVFLPEDPDRPYVPPHCRIIGTVKDDDGKQTYINAGDDDFESLRNLDIVPLGTGTYRDFRDVMTRGKYRRSSLRMADNRFRASANWVLEQGQQQEYMKSYYSANRRVKREHSDLQNYIVKRRYREDGSAYVKCDKSKVEYDAGILNDDAREWARINKDLNFMCEEYGRDPDLFITLTTSPHFPEIKLLFKRYPDDYKHYTDCGPEIAELSFKRLVRFCKMILFSDEEGIFPADTRYFVRCEWNNDTAITHFHINVWTPEGWDFNQITCSENNTDTDYPSTKKALRKQYHFCKYSHNKCLKVDSTGKPFCSKHYPRKLHTHDSTCVKNCRKTVRRKGEEWMSEYIAKLFYLWAGSDDGCTINCRVIRNTGSLLGYTTKYNNYICKPCDTEVDIRELFSAATPYQCMYCNKTFTTRAGKHEALCKDRTVWKCITCGRIFKRTYIQAMDHINKCSKKDESQFERRRRIQSMLQKARVRPMMSTVWSLLGLPKIWCNTSIERVYTIPPWKYHPTIARNRTVNKRDGKNDPNNFNESAYEKFIKRPLQLKITPKLRLSKNITEFLVRVSDCTDTNDVALRVRYGHPIIVDMLKVNFREYFQCFTMRKDELHVRTQRKMVRFYDVGTYSEYSSYLWFCACMHPISASWHKTILQNVPTKDTMRDYALTNAVINPESELFEKSILENKNLKTHMKMKLLIKHAREFSSFENIRKAISAVSDPSDSFQENTLPTTATWFEPRRYAQSMFERSPIIHARYNALDTKSHDFMSLIHHAHVEATRRNETKRCEIIVRLDSRESDWDYHHSVNGQTYAFPGKLNALSNFIAIRMFHVKDKGIQFVVLKRNYHPSRVEQINTLLKALANPPPQPVSVLYTRSNHAVNFARHDNEFPETRNLASKYFGDAGTRMCERQEQVIEQLFHRDGTKKTENIMALGKCGTGKTSLLRYIIQKYGEKGYNVGVTATTATASSLTNGFTLERFLGIVDVSIHGEQLVNNILEKPEVVQRIRDMHVLIVDECSMLKYELYEDVNLVLQRVRNSDEIFGGVTIILAGDFLQFRPVSSNEDKPSAKYIFEHPHFHKMIHNTVELRTNYRVKDPLLRELLSHLETGKLTQEDIGMLESRVFKDIKTAPISQNAVYIMPTWEEVYKTNHRFLHKVLTGDMHTFHAVNFGYGDYQKRCVPHLSLKIGSRVQLTTNTLFSHRGIVHASFGTVVGFKHYQVTDPDSNAPGYIQLCPVVLFDKDNNDFETGIPPITFYSRHNRSNETISHCRQFPLRLAHAITGHGAQGSEIPAGTSIVTQIATINKECFLYCFTGRAQQLKDIFFIGPEKPEFKKSAGKIDKLSLQLYNSIGLRSNRDTRTPEWKKPDTSLPRGKFVPRDFFDKPSEVTTGNVHDPATDTPMQNAEEPVESDDDEVCTDIPIDTTPAKPSDPRPRPASKKRPPPRTAPAPRPSKRSKTQSPFQLNQKVIHKNGNIGKIHKIYNGTFEVKFDDSNTVIHCEITDLKPAPKTKRKRTKSATKSNPAKRSRTTPKRTFENHLNQCPFEAPAEILRRVYFQHKYTYDRISKMKTKPNTVSKAVQQMLHELAVQTNTRKRLKAAQKSVMKTIYKKIPLLVRKGETFSPEDWLEYMFRETRVWKQIVGWNQREDYHPCTNCLHNHSMQEQHEYIIRTYDSWVPDDRQSIDLATILKSGLHKTNVPANCDQCNRMNCVFPSVSVNPRPLLIFQPQMITKTIQYNEKIVINDNITYRFAGRVRYTNANAASPNTDLLYLNASHYNGEVVVNDTLYKFDSLHPAKFTEIRHGTTEENQWG